MQKAMALTLGTAFGLSLFWAQPAIAAEDAAKEGRRVAELSDALNRGFVDESATMTMLLVGVNGDTITRRIKSMTLERADSEDYSLIQFLEPADVRGTGLLTYQNPRGDDQQWLYLPELRRVKTIASKNKSGSFMGSEFAFEDITGNTLDKFSYRKVGEAKLQDIDCDLIEKIPTYANSGYTKVKVWLDKKTHLAHRLEYFDRKNTLMKVQTFTGWKLYGKVWRADAIAMDNLQTKKKSVLRFSDRKLGAGLKEEQFTQRNLQRLQF